MIAISLTLFLLFKISLILLDAGVGGRPKKNKILKSHEDKANELSMKNNPKKSGHILALNLKRHCIDTFISIDSYEICRHLFVAVHKIEDKIDSNKAS